MSVTRFFVITMLLVLSLCFLSSVSATRLRSVSTEIRNEAIQKLKLANLKLAQVSQGISDSRARRIARSASRIQSLLIALAASEAFEECDAQRRANINRATAIRNPIRACRDNVIPRASLRVIEVACDTQRSTRRTLARPEFQCESFEKGSMVRRQCNKARRALRNQRRDAKNICDQLDDIQPQLDACGDLDAANEAVSAARSIQCPAAGRTSQNIRRVIQEEIDNITELLGNNPYPSNDPRLPGTDPRNVSGL